VLILPDENLLSKKLKQPLIDAGHSARNVEDMGWRGTKDRELLSLAVANSFDVLITADKNLPYQQSLRDVELRVVVLNAASTRPNYLLPLIIQISELLESLDAGSITGVNDTGEVIPFSIG
jgi:predicted nuclease of predicted toxin-antitoxin system